MTRLDDGFTLLEIIVVMALIAVTGLIVYPTLSTTLEKARMDGCVRDVATLLKYARELSTAQQEVVAVVIRREQGDVTIFAGGGKALKHYRLWRRVSFSKVILEGIDLTDNPAVVWFYPDGRSTGLAVVMKNEDGRQLRLKTDILTGNTRVLVPGEKGFDDGIFGE